jgi:periplasmic protein TonB
MAFDAYRSQSQNRPRRRRRITYTLSLVFHGALVAVGIAYSFWHVEELSPPTLRVTFMSAITPEAPPAPPPPPPAGGGAPKKKTVVKTKPIIVPTKPPEIVQPRETPPPPKKEEPKPDDHDEPGGVKGGVKGGVAGGVVGGVQGGTPGGVVGGTPGGGSVAPLPSKFLPPNLGALQKISGDEPPFPPSLRKAGLTYAIVAKICVSPGGAVSAITLMKKADPQLDAGVVSTVKTWRFRPLMANDTAVPFCYPATFQFKGQ